MRQLGNLIVELIPASAAFTDDDRQQAARLIDACCVAVSGSLRPADLSEAMGLIRKDCGPWLDEVRGAIDRAPLDPIDRAALLGAFQMAAVILFDATHRRILKHRPSF